MDRPKSLAHINLKLPEELLSYVDENRLQHHPPKTRSEWFRDAAEFKAIIGLGMRLNVYELIEQYVALGRIPGNTNSSEVLPKSRRAA